MIVVFDLFFGCVYLFDIEQVGFLQLFDLELVVFNSIVSLLVCICKVMEQLMKSFLVIYVVNLVMVYLIVVLFDFISVLLLYMVSLLVFFVCIECILCEQIIFIDVQVFYVKELQQMLGNVLGMLQIVEYSNLFYQCLSNCMIEEGWEVIYVYMLELQLFYYLLCWVQIGQVCYLWLVLGVWFKMVVMNQCGNFIGECDCMVMFLLVLMVNLMFLYVKIVLYNVYWVVVIDVYYVEQLCQVQVCECYGVDVVFIGEGVLLVMIEFMLVISFGYMVVIFLQGLGYGVVLLDCSQKMVIQQEIVVMVIFLVEYMQVESLFMVGLVVVLDCIDYDLLVECLWCGGVDGLDDVEEFNFGQVFYICQLDIFQVEVCYYCYLEVLEQVW